MVFRARGFNSLFFFRNIIILQSVLCMTVGILAQNKSTSYLLQQIDQHARKLLNGAGIFINIRSFQIESFKLPKKSQLI